MIFMRFIRTLLLLAETDICQLDDFPSEVCLSIVFDLNARCLA